MSAADGGRPAWAKALSDVEFEFALRDHFSVEAAAAYLGVSVPWVQQRTRSGELPHRFVGARKRIRKADLDRILDRGSR